MQFVVKFIEKLLGLNMKKKNKYAFEIEVFNRNNGILRLKEAVTQGIQKHKIYAMLSAGIITREERGLYSLKLNVNLSSPDLVKVTLLIPKAVICLSSALYYYQLTTQIPTAVTIALPNYMRTPKIEYPPIEAVKLSTEIYNAGIEVHILDGKQVKIYSIEKTITDCFKFRSKIGKEIAIEALKDYGKKYRPNLSELIKYAKLNRVEKIMRPYIETLL